MLHKDMKIEYNILASYTFEAVIFLSLAQLT